jgi:NitT/TauT family transport system ATP-binding protein
LQGDRKVLEVEDLSFYYEGQWLLKNLSFQIKKGEIATLIGASGSGKTTLFKLVTGILKPHKGSISVAGQTVSKGHGNVAYMMQEDLLLPWRTALNNLILISELGKVTKSKESALAQAKQLLQEMEMSQCADLFPHQLSGGMRQRVSLARALMHKKPLLLLDEPFNALDVILREQMYVLLRNMRKKLQTTILLVTHDFRDALSLSDHIFLLKNSCISREWHITDDMRNDPHESVRVLNEMRLSMSE